MMNFNKQLPKKLYKFMEPQFLQQIEKHNRFYINFLGNYKEGELGSEVGDDNEGTLRTSFTIDNYTFSKTSNNKNPLFETLFHTQQNLIELNGNNVTLQNVTIQSNNIDNNYFVFCCCTDNNKSLNQHFGQSLLIINDVNNFIKCINAELLKYGIEMIIANKCIYLPNSEVKISPDIKAFYYHYPPLVKENRYSYQNEFKILWKYNNNKKITKPLSIKCKEAIKYCSFEY